MSRLEKIALPLWLAVFGAVVVFVVYPPDKPIIEPMYFAIVLLAMAAIYWIFKNVYFAWRENKREKTAWEILAEIAEKHTDPLFREINPGPPIYGNAKSIEIHPDGVKHAASGWPLSMVKLLYTNEAFALPEEHSQSYRNYADDKADEFQRDGDKLCLALLPKVYSDGDKELTLRVVNTKYSVVRYSNEFIATNPEMREAALQQLYVDRRVTFANSLCLHSIIFTADTDPLCLIVRRNKDMAWHGGKWAASLEEQIQIDDLKGTAKHGILGKWTARLLDEEMSLYEEDGHFSLDNCKLLSLFLEGDILNIALCVIIKLSLTRQQLDSILHGSPRTDYEFSTWRYMSRAELRALLLENPEELLREWHPTSGYRMLMALLHFGKLSK